MLSLRSKDGEVASGTRIPYAYLPHLHDNNNIRFCKFPNRQLEGPNSERGG